MFLLKKNNNMSYFPLVGQNGTQSSKSSRKDNDFKNNFLIICRYLKLVNKQKIILHQIETSQVVSSFNIKILNRSKERNIIYFHWDFIWKWILLSALKGNNSCKMCNFRIKGRNVQMVYLYITVNSYIYLYCMFINLSEFTKRLLF